MARYGLIWLEIAHADYTSLPEHTRDQINALIEQLLENPPQPRDSYDELTDQRTTTYGGGAGLIVYAVVHQRQRVIILRLVQPRDTRSYGYHQVGERRPPIPIRSLVRQSAHMVGDRVVHGYASGRDAVRLMTASFRTHHFVPHDHAEYAVAAIERGVEAVRYRGATHHAGVGSLLLLDAEVLHAGRPGVAEGWDYRVFYVPPALLVEIAGAPPALADPTPYDPDLARALSLVHRRLQDGDGDVMATQERLHELLTAVVQRYAHGGALGARASRAEVRRVQRYLAADLHARPGLDDLAAVAGLPRHRLLRAFRRETGLSPHGYLTQLRLRRAQQLLTAGSTVARAAAEAGFHDQSHLTRHFRRTFAAPPGRFARSRHRVQDPRPPAP